MDRLDLPVSDLGQIVDDGMVFPLIRENGEWRIDWEDITEEELESLGELFE